MQEVVLTVLTTGRFFLTSIHSLMLDIERLRMAVGLQEEEAPQEEETPAEQETPGEKKEEEEEETGKEETSK